jgi:hypothetical protein
LGGIKLRLRDPEQFLGAGDSLAVQNDPRHWPGLDTALGHWEEEPADQRCTYGAVDPNRQLRQVGLLRDGGGLILVIEVPSKGAGLAREDA